MNSLKIEIKEFRLIKIGYFQFFILLLLTIITPSQAHANSITFHITDFGINQYWSKSMKVGNSFTNPDPMDSKKEFHNRAYPELNLMPEAQIIIPMPSDQDFKSKTDTQITNEITVKLINTVNRALKQGATEFEIQLVQNVRTPGYFDSSRQKLVTRFWAAASGAIGRMADGVGHEKTVILDASLASNGTHGFASSVEHWQPFAHYFRSIDMADGRATLPDMRKTLDVLGGGRVITTNTQGDYWAPSPLMAGAYNVGRSVLTPHISRKRPIEASMGNLDTIKKLVSEYPEMRAFFLEPLDTKKGAHIRRMIDPNARYKVEQLYSTGSGVSRYQLNGIHSARDLRHYATGLANPSVDVQSTPHWLAPSLVSREQAEDFSANVGALSTVMSFHGFQGDGVGKPLEIAQRFYDLGIAIEKDFKAAGNGNYVLLQSNTMRQASLLTAKKLFKEAGIPNLGTIDVVRAGMRNISTGYADVDTIDLYFTGANKLAWGALGYVVVRYLPLSPKEKAKVAGAFQDYGDALRQLGGAVVLKQAKKIYSRKNALQVEEMWRTVQTARATNGLKIQTITEFLGPVLVKQQFKNKDIQRINSEAASISRNAKPLNRNSTQHYSMKEDPAGPSNRDFSNAKLMGEMTHASKRTVIFGDGELAKKSYDTAIARHGKENVKWVHYMPSSLERNAISTRFRAESTMTIHQSSETWREVSHQGIKSIIPIPLQPKPKIPMPKMKPQLEREDDDLYVIVDIPFYWGDDDEPPPLGPGGEGDDDDDEPPPPGPGGGGGVAFDHFAHNYQNSSQSIGGVMLKGAASVTGDSAELGVGDFALLFESNDAGMDIGELRMFITALWSVYFSKEGPGVSIDPIAPDIDKHLVRYIGQVINSDLGRVMREADYLMKKWSVGTERADCLPNFRNPDDIAGERGTMGQSAWSRFWFIPEDMRFHRSGDMLLFDGGSMTLKTEYLSPRMRNKTDAANEQFATEFTKSYTAVAECYPVFQELFDYAKMVSLAKYLKNSGVPMSWYLLANKDLILTEDSPGVVNALATKSKYFKDVEISGGVDLAVVPSSDKYVFDEEAVKALIQARKRYQKNDHSHSLTGTESIVFETDDVDYTLVSPQTIALSGSAIVGETFQTDIAMRLNGEPRIELIRYYDPLYQGIASFGYGWHLGIPYRLVPEGEERTSFLNGTIPKKMTIENLMSGRKEVLTFNRERYSIEGYVPDDPELSGLIGVFILSNGTFRLADKIGSEYQFNRAGQLTDIILTENYIVSYKYDWEKLGFRAFNRPPYRIEPVGEKQVSVLNVTLPKTMQLLDEKGHVRETFFFDSEEELDVVGYRPLNKERSNYSYLAVLSDGSFQLVANQGSEISFDGSGRFKRIREPVVKRVVQGDYQIDFQYEYYDLAFRIETANVVKKGIKASLYTVQYAYGADGRLNSVRRPEGKDITIKYKEDAVMLSNVSGKDYNFDLSALASLVSMGEEQPHENYR